MLRNVNSVEIVNPLKLLRIPSPFRSSVHRLQQLQASDFASEDKFLGSTSLFQAFFNAESEILTQKGWLMLGRMNKGRVA